MNNLLITSLKNELPLLSRKLFFPRVCGSNNSRTSRLKVVFNSVFDLAVYEVVQFIK